MNKSPQNVGAAQALADLFRHTDLAALAGRHNIAPSEQILAVRHRADGPGYELVALRWGLMPAGPADRRLNHPLTHARAETAAERPAFRSAFRQRRCLVLADGFYVWKNTGGRRQPYHVRLHGGQPFAFAGLWEPPADAAKSAAETGAVLMVPANALLRPLTPRMPAIVSVQDYEVWLDPSVQEPERLHDLLRPYPAKEMETVAVSQYVNDPHHEYARCTRPLGQANERTLF